MAEPAPRVDWEAIERSPEFQELVHRRRRFVLPCTAFFLTWYMGFILVCAYAPDFVGDRIYQGLTVGYVYALTQFLMVFGLGFWYLKKAERVFDPLAERAVAAYAGHDTASPSERLERTRVAAAQAEAQR